MSKFAIGLLTLAMYAASLPVIMITPAQAATKKHWRPSEPWYAARAQQFVPPYSQAGPICLASPEASTAGCFLLQSRTILIEEKGPAVAADAARKGRLVVDC